MWSWRSIEGRILHGNSLIGIGFNHTISIEVSTCEYHDKYHNDVRKEGNVKVDFHSHFSDDSDQNAATIFEHSKFVFHWMYGNKLFIKYGIMYDTIDEYRKKYICANVMWLLYVL